MTKERFNQIWEELSDEQKAFVAVIVEAVRNPPSEYKQHQTEISIALKNHINDTPCQLQTAIARENRQYSDVDCRDRVVTGYDMYKQMNRNGEIIYD